MIIGLTGPMGSGKTTVVETLLKKGYKLVTLSDMVREECRKRKLPEEREQLMAVGQSLREQFGAGVLAKRALEKIKLQTTNLPAVAGYGLQTSSWIIDGIRNPAEAIALRQDPRFILIANTAPEEMIIKRILLRHRNDDTLNKEAIRKKLRREMGEGEPEDGQQLAKCIAMADYIFENTMPFEKVETEFSKFYDKIKSTL